MKECMDSANLHKRLSRISGQIAALDRMIDEDIPCEQILIQVNAVDSAVRKVGRIIMEGHVNNCLRKGVESGDVEGTLKMFEEVLDQYSKI